MSSQKIALPCPIAGGVDQRLTVSTAVVQLAALPDAATHVFIDVQSNPVMVTFYASNPSAVNGHLLNAGDKLTLTKALATAAKFIRQGGSDAVLHASPITY